MREKFKNLFKAAAFITIFAIILAALVVTLDHPSEERNFQAIGGFYEEAENTLDAVYFGSSNCYAFWNPVIAWQDYGMAVYPYSSSSQSFWSVAHLIREVHKTQPQALIIVNTNTASERNIDEVSMHRLLSYMPWSENKVDLINYLSDMVNYSKEERLEFYFPFIRFHGRWIDLEAWDIFPRINGLKGASTYEQYLTESEDITDIYLTGDETAQQLYGQQFRGVMELLNYCDAEKVNILFVTVPRAETSVEALQMINSVNEMIRDRGYPVLDLMDSTEEMGIDLSLDYYNRKHTNIHGSIKFTQYISEYLAENYGFEDKRGQPAYASWDAAVGKYAGYMKSSVLDFEVVGRNRDYSLDVPGNLRAEACGDGARLCWENVENADGYAVYRQDDSASPWRVIGLTDQNTYLDRDGGGALYRVVPYCVRDGEKYYGHFDYNGAAVNG